MGKRFKQTFLRRRHTDDQQANEKRLHHLSEIKIELGVLYLSLQICQPCLSFREKPVPFCPDGRPESDRLCQNLRVHSEAACLFYAVPLRKLRNNDVGL